MNVPQGRWKDELRQRIVVLGAIVALVWLLEAADLLLWRLPLDRYGIHPRTWLGLRNILFAPWLHVGFGHLAANTVPFVVLGWFVSLHGMRAFWQVTVTTLLVSGLAIWLLGAPNTVHLGLSGLVFGYLGYLLVRGFVERSLRAALLALLALALYGGMLWGLVSWAPGVSWLGHAFGFLGGAVAARRVK